MAISRERWGSPRGTVAREDQAGIELAAPPAADCQGSDGDREKMSDVLVGFVEGCLIPPRSRTSRIWRNGIASADKAVDRRQAAARGIDRGRSR